MKPDINNKLKRARRLYKAGDYAAAINQYEKLRKRAPANPDVLYGLGKSYLRIDQSEQAIALFNQAIQAGMRKADVFAENAAAMNKLHRYDEAENMARAAVAIEPGHVSAMRYLVKALLSQSRYEDGLTCGRRLIQLSPANAADHVLLGWATFTMERFDETLQLANKAIELDADSAEARYLLSRVYKNVQQWQTALDMAEQALTIAPENPEYLAMKANMLEHLGQFEAAFGMAEPLVGKYRVGNGLAVLVYARLAKRFGKQDRAITLLEELVSNSQSLVSLRHSALTLLGKAYDSSGEYDKAFEAIDKANKIRPLRYSETNMLEYIEEITGWFTSERIKNTPSAGRGSSAPIFIVGMPRSGTSLTEKILSRHPKVQAGGETLQLPKLLHEDLPAMLESELPFPTCLQSLTTELADQAAAKFLQDMGLEEGKRITEKRPMNFIYLGAICKIFPDAKIIHCTRDPLDVGLSCYFADFTSATELGFSQDLELLGNYTKRYRQLMSKWHERLPLSILDVSYEALVSDPENEIKKLLEFCDLPWHEECLHPHQSTQLTTTASYNQVREPINTSSIGRWKHYDRHLNPLKSVLGLQDSRAA